MTVSKLVNTVLELRERNVEYELSRRGTEVPWICRQSGLHCKLTLRAASRFHLH